MAQAPTPPRRPRPPAGTRDVRSVLDRDARDGVDLPSRTGTVTGTVRKAGRHRSNTRKTYGARRARHMLRTAYPGMYLHARECVPAVCRTHGRRTGRGNGLD